MELFYNFLWLLRYISLYLKQSKVIKMKKTINASIKRKAQKASYGFIVPAGINSRSYDIEAYTLKQAKFLFRKEHGTINVVNIIKAKI